MNSTIGMSMIAPMIFNEDFCIGICTKYARIVAFFYQYHNVYCFIYYLDSSFYVWYTLIRFTSERRYLRFCQFLIYSIHEFDLYAFDYYNYSAISNRSFIDGSNPPTAEKCRDWCCVWWSEWRLYVSTRY